VTRIVVWFYYEPLEVVLLANGWKIKIWSVLEFAAAFNSFPVFRPASKSRMLVVSSSDKMRSRTYSYGGLSNFFTVDVFFSTKSTSC